jgi:hypothetical protein
MPKKIGRRDGAPAYLLVQLAHLHSFASMLFWLMGALLAWCRRILLSSV